MISFWYLRDLGYVHQIPRVFCIQLARSAKGIFQINYFIMSRVHLKSVIESCQAYIGNQLLHNGLKSWRTNIFFLRWLYLLTRDIIEMESSVYLLLVQEIPDQIIGTQFSIKHQRRLEMSPCFEHMMWCFLLFMRNNVCNCMGCVNITNHKPTR